MFAWQAHLGQPAVLTLQHPFNALLAAAEQWGNTIVTAWVQETKATSNVTPKGVPHPAECDASATLEGP